jgi:hypothetical protein
MIPATIPLHEDSAIGSDVERTRRQLLDICDDLQETAEPALRDRIAPIRTQLANFVARIAIVGQMKAGKSTLTNSLTRQAALLPADINPWTSVVTRLHFGHPSGQTSGARFSFFDELQWQRLATRGGRLGELTEGLLDDYKREELFLQVNAMQSRARQRLGDSFEKLLGKTHRFETVTSEIVERYVCAGEEAEERLNRPAAGRYNDITHAADIFFPRAPFGCAVCIMDTPGTNDPLLIREEITHQNLENADYFVIVLTAHQALTDTDLQLVRVLKALKRDRMIAFVNRIDEVNNLVPDFEALRAQVQGRLAKELGGERIPVILGSAEWAGRASFGAEARGDEKLIAEVSALKRGLPDFEGVASDLGHGSKADRLLASGLAELEAILSKSIASGASATLFAGVMDELTALSRQVAGLAAVRLRSVDPEKAATPAPTFEIGTDAINRVIERVDTWRAKIRQSCEASRTETRIILASMIDKRLAENGAELLGVKPAADGSNGLDTLRDDLQERCHTGFSAAVDITWDALREINSAHLTMFKDPEAGPIANVKARTLGVLAVEPDYEKIYRPITLDVANNWFTNLLHRSGARLKSAMDLAGRQLLEACDAVLDQCIGEVAEEFEAATEAYLDDLNRVADGLIKAQKSSAPYTAKQAEAEYRAATSALQTLEALATDLGVVPSKSHD